MPSDYQPPQVKKRKKRSKRREPSFLLYKRIDRLEKTHEIFDVYNPLPSEGMTAERRQQLEEQLLAEDEAANYPKSQI